MVQTVIKLLAFATLSLDIVLILFILSFALKKLNKKIIRFLKGREVFFAFIFALVAMLGSLFLSEIAHFSPCLLCWYQRIFMYPLTFILGVAHFRKTRDVEKYVLPLASIGIIIATYHYYLQRAANPFAPCSALGYAVSCTEKFFMYYGYITIPFMALSAFAAIIILMILKKRRTE
jgi:disulfide bond formation protein DsbB